MLIGILMNSVFKKDKVKLLLILFFLGMYILCTSPVNAAADIRVTSQQIRFDVKTKPTADISANHKIRFERRKERKFDSKSIYYIVNELQDNRGNSISPKYLRAKMSGWSDYHALDNFIKFLDDDDLKSTVKFKLAKEAWWKVPSGTYKGWLESGKSPAIRVIVHIRSYTNVSVYPDNVEINATSGPGIYKPEEKARLKVEANHHNWLLNINTEPLIYQGDSDDEAKILPKNILLALGDSEYSYNKMDEKMIINGSNYRRGINTDISLKVKVGWKHTAGTYKGKINFTLTNR
ncbi:hypothetical protein [Selenihalanaerobacter shriftii]|uniref:Uncharacterized protein n=1 Tax=Selenihalanaerobacter shriftii TaxID=142842 RepID=A0A1T4JQX9_9FIRM|nr:hypothetical protein [Selenihalanaerobacter shriftii]SJZ32586.1 hypothetical protein SAMN02745118_00342 [Selenihalanaerobacter shriftii]